jgi:glycosyltransferase involved in cell wall biosynthesis
LLLFQKSAAFTKISMVSSTESISREHADEGLAHERMHGSVEQEHAKDAESTGRMAKSATVRVLFCCTGVGVFNRGIETFFREAFDGLKGLDGIETRLVKGAGEAREDEHRAWILPRTGRLAPLLGKLAGRNGYVVEQWSSLPSVVRQIREFRPHVVYYSDANLGMLLHRLRRRIGVPFRLLFSNGGPCHPPFVRTDFVHQVAPLYYEEALAAGEPAEKHIFVPYGINVPEAPPSCDPEEKRRLRARLKLPADRPIVLSVGLVSARHKRMDFVVREVAPLPSPRPFLMLLGAMDESSREIVELAERVLGQTGFAVRSTPYDEVADYYRAADCFVLASLKEGFGRVFLESLMHGLPTIAHRHPVIEYVLGDDGLLCDLSVPGALTTRLREALAVAGDATASGRRWASVRKRFSWESLRPHYRDMLLRCSVQPAP